MTDPGVASFNVGGHKYEVSRSLLLQHPNTMLAICASEQWQTDDPTSEIFIERDGQRFGLVLDYLRDGKVVLPLTVTKASFLTDLEYYCVDIINTDPVSYDASCVTMIMRFLEIQRAEGKTLRNKANDLMNEADDLRKKADELDLALACFGLCAKDDSLIIKFQEGDDNGLYDIAVQANVSAFEETNCVLAKVGLRIQSGNEIYFTFDDVPNIFQVILKKV